MSVGFNDRLGCSRERLCKELKDIGIGQEAYPARLALGSLIVQNRKALSDRDTVSEITENPYMQYFIGLQAFTEEAPFDASLMVHFRKRFNLDYINSINEKIANPNKDDGGSPHPNSGGTTEGSTKTINSEEQADNPNATECDSAIALDNQSEETAVIPCSDATAESGASKHDDI